MSAGSNALKKFYYETTVLRNSGPIPSQAAFDQQIGDPDWLSTVS
eukprot:COSAG01_NODE_5953_length_3931_cov_21.491141_2_plen_45_part_00